MDKISFFILNIFLNSLLSFVTVVLLIEGIIFLLRIPQGRIAAILRMIPIVKLPLDLCLYDFSRWSYSHGINPLNCQEGTRMLSIVFGGISDFTEWLLLPVSSSIQFTVLGNMTFTVADILGYSMGSKLLGIFTLLFTLITVTLLFTKCLKCYQSIKSLNSLEKTARLNNRKTRNFTITSYLKNYQLQILTSSSLRGSPFVAGLTSYNVYVPEQLSKALSRREYEAVLAHEIEHIRHKDSLVRLILDFIESIFWWVPTKWLHKRIEEGQEVGCDLKCEKYRIHPNDLASAICKSVRHSINAPTHIFAHHLTKNTVYKRVDILLKPKSIRFRRVSYICSVFATGIAFLVILVGRFWIF
ncbi:M56 family metallopeptidase [Parachlamydia sp. AcF125]|uniref:M56 family metallopeptidase n=1 Tax=Parachlamydia sp. AcF125 TaxID=2795736 RepID=UPI001BCA0187|nr:M56 family metallopeptidase [Parachlamydia sp. AcF125]MBS4167512.1 Protease HtpX [Parachlamydia sp. AcF125]